MSDVCKTGVFIAKVVLLGVLIATSTLAVFAGLQVLFSSAIDASVSHALYVSCLAFARTFVLSSIIGSLLGGCWFVAKTMVKIPSGNYFRSAPKDWLAAKLLLCLKIFVVADVGLATICGGWCAVVDFVSQNCYLIGRCSAISADFYLGERVAFAVAWVAIPSLVVYLVAWLLFSWRPRDWASLFDSFRPRPAPKRASLFDSFRRRPAPNRRAD